MVLFRCMCVYMRVLERERGGGEGREGIERETEECGERTHCCIDLFLFLVFVLRCSQYSALCFRRVYRHSQKNLIIVLVIIIIII